MVEGEREKKTNHKTNCKTKKPRNNNNNKTQLNKAVEKIRVFLVICHCGNESELLSFRSPIQMSTNISSSLLQWCQSTHSTATLFTHERPHSSTSTFVIRQRQRAEGGYSKAVRWVSRREFNNWLGVFYQTWNTWRCLLTHELEWPPWPKTLALTESGTPLQPERCLLDIVLHCPLPPVTEPYVIPVTITFCIW